MTNGTQCNKCLKWFPDDDKEIDIKAQQRGYVDSHYGFHLCHNCSVKLVQEWLPTHNLLGTKYKEIKHLEEWEKHR